MVFFLRKNGCKLTFRSFAYKRDEDERIVEWTPKEVLPQLEKVLETEKSPEIVRHFKQAIENIKEQEAYDKMIRDERARSLKYAK